MIQKVANGRFEVERVDGTESVWWVYDYRARRAAFVVITPAANGGLQVLNEDTGRAHIVDAEARCDCPAGQRGLFCYHVAAITGRAMELRRERSARALANVHPSRRPVSRRKPAVPACLGPLAGQVA